MIIRIKSRTTAATPQRKVGHTRARASVLDLDYLGRLRVGHMLAYLGVSHSTFYQGLKTGRYPQPDGRDGKIPFWNTATIRAFLDGEKTATPINEMSAASNHEGHARAATLSSTDF